MNQPRVIRILKASGFSEENAEEFFEELYQQNAELCTKSDLKDMQLQIITKISDLQKDMDTKFIAVHKDIGDIKGEVGNVKGEVGNVKGEMGKLVLKILGGISLILAITKGLEWYLTSSHP